MTARARTGDCWQTEPREVLQIDLLDPSALGNAVDGNHMPAFCVLRAGPHLIGLAWSEEIDLPDARRGLPDGLRKRMCQHVLSQALRAPPSSPAGYGIEQIASQVFSPVSSAPPPVSVCVCTTGRRDTIVATLESLASHAPETEILVIHNDAECAKTRAWLEGLHPRARYISEPRPGLNLARNKGLIEARTPLVAYLDDDAEIDGGWMAALNEAVLDDPDTAVFTGPALPKELETSAQILFEAYAGYQRGVDPIWWRLTLAAAKDPSMRFRTWEIGTGANMVFRRDALLGIGGFDPSLCIATATRGSGDLDAFYRMACAGHELRYEPDLIAWHRHRRTFPELKSQIASFGSFACYVEAAATAHPGELADIIRLVPFLAGYFAWRLRTVWDGPIPLGLVAHELRGYVEAVALRRWRRARRDAFRREQAGDLRPLRPAWRPVPRQSAGLAVTLDLRDGIHLLALPDAPARIEIAVRIGPHHLGHISVLSATRHVPARRLRDLIARDIGAALLAPAERTLSEDVFLARIVARGSGHRAQHEARSPSPNG